MAYTPTTQPVVDTNARTSSQDEPVTGPAVSVQTATVTGSPGGGTVKLGFRGAVTGTIAYNATGATVQTALEALPNIDTGDISVSGSGGGPWVVTFTAEGQYGREKVPTLTLADNSLTGGTSPSVTIERTTENYNVQVPSEADGSTSDAFSERSATKPSTTIG